VVADVYVAERAASPTEMGMRTVVGLVGPEMDASAT
jgi:hypothetical protein